MTGEQLATLIREYGVEEIGRTVADFARQFTTAMQRGWNLTNWQVDVAGGCVLFAPIAGDGAKVLCLNAPESARAEWEARLWLWATKDAARYGDTILLMTPQ